nr:hypothetical protein [Tanacetum cinerariifolium]
VNKDEGNDDVKHKPKPRPTRDFKPKYNKVKAKLALLSSNALASKSLMVKNKGLINEAYEWDEEEVSSDDNEMVEVKVLMALVNDNVAVNKEGARNGEWVKISMKKHVNTEILKENRNLRKKLKELIAITDTRLNISNKVNQCIIEQILTQKKRILGVDQLTKDPSSFGKKDLVFVKSSADDTKVSIPSVERPWLSEAKGFILLNHDIADEYSICITPLPLLEKLVGAKPVSEPKTIKSILKSNSTFEAETLKGFTINKPSSAPTKAKNKASASKTNSALAGKVKNVKTEDELPLTIVMKELNDLKLQISKNQSSYFKSNKLQQVPQNTLQNKYKTQFKRCCKLCGLNNHLSESCYNVLFCKKSERTNHRTCDHAKYMSTMNMSQHHKGQGGSSSRSITSRPSNTSSYLAYTMGSVIIYPMTV